MLLLLLMNLPEHFSFLQPLKSDHTSVNPHLKHVVVVVVVVVVAATVVAVVLVIAAAAVVVVVVVVAVGV